jgi:hypothetical protein
MALLILGGLAFCFAFFGVPKENHDFIIYVLGALSGALTVGSGRKLADKITNSTGDGATIQPELPEPRAASPGRTSSRRAHALPSDLPRPE